VREILALQAIPDSEEDTGAPGVAVTGLTSWISVDNGCSTVCSVVCPSWG